MTNEWIEWNGGECPIKSDKTRVDVKLRNFMKLSMKLSVELDWSHTEDSGDIIAYRITEDHEPKMTNEWIECDVIARRFAEDHEPKMTRGQIEAQIEALLEQLDALPVVEHVWYGAGGFWHSYHSLATRRFDIETINGVPHIHGVAMKEVVHPPRL